MAEGSKNKDGGSPPADKRRIQGFLNDILRFGSVKGFRYFEMSLRGREELLLTVQNEQYHSPSENCNFKLSSLNVEEEEDEDQSSFDFNQNLPRNYESLILSRSTQKMLSGFHFLEIGLPPASPCNTEITPSNGSTTLFLLAAYARYKCPYVWVRSNHERLVRLAECEIKEQTRVRDSPLKLKTVSDWSVNDIKVWDIIAEIVRMNVVPAPRNPFAVNHAYFDRMPLEERVIATGAMVYFLQRVLAKDHSFNTLVSDDLHEVLKTHFMDLQSLALSRGMEPRSSVQNNDEQRSLKSYNSSSQYQKSSTMYYGS